MESYKQEQDTIQVVEQQILDLTHETISYELLTHWKLPELLCAAVSTHHFLIDQRTSKSPVEGLLGRVGCLQGVIRRAHRVGMGLGRNRT